MCVSISVCVFDRRIALCVCVCECELVHVFLCVDMYVYVCAHVFVLMCDLYVAVYVCVHGTSAGLALEYFGMIHRLGRRCVCPDV